MGKANFDKQHAELTRREESVARREQDLAKRQVGISELEASFRLLKEQAESLKKEVQEGRERLLDQQKAHQLRELELDQLLTKRAEEALSNLNAELDRRRRAVAVEVSAAADHAAAMRSQQAAVLEKTRKELDMLLDLHRAGVTEQLGQGLDALNTLRAEFRDKQFRQAAETEQDAVRATTRMSELQTKFADTRAKLEGQLAQALGEVRFLQGRKTALEERLKNLEQGWSAVGDEPQDVLAEISRLKHELTERETAAATKRMKDRVKDYDELRQASGEKDRAIARLNGEVKALELEMHRMKRSEAMRDIIKGNFEVVQKQNESLQMQNLVFDSIIKDQQEKYERLTEAVIDKSKPPGFINQGDPEWFMRIGDLQRWRITPQNPAKVVPEKVWLADLESNIAAAGMRYSQRLLYSFHTSLKIAEWSPLTVLSGVSGTGKSELPRLYSKFGGLHFNSVAVQPNWDSPQDLFGFFNFMDNRFNARELLRDMAQSQQPQSEGGFDSQMLLVLLDEMNLARVELYLSELLSKWELRRGDKRVELSFDLGPNCQKYVMPLRPNVIFAGTVNEDESTQTLSEKVLDRGNMLYFPRPDALADRQSLTLEKDAAPLAYDTWKSWLRLPPPASDKKPRDDKEALLKEICDEYRTVIQKMNDALALVERGVGHRVWQAVVIYLCNHPLVCSATAGELKDAARIAFEDQVIQRIVPKLRGLVNEGAAEKCFADIREQIDGRARGLLTDFDAALGASDRGFAWRQSAYLNNPLPLK